MSKLKRLIALALCTATVLSSAAQSFAATVDTAVIDTSKTASLTLYKYDMTRAEGDHVWDSSSYVSTGIYDSTVNNTLGNAGQINNSTPNPASYGYAINGVEFTYLKVADIQTSSKETAPGKYQVSLQYGFAQDARSEAVLEAIGLQLSDASAVSSSISYFTSDMLNAALASSLASNATTVKNKLETAVRTYGGTAMTATDAYGKTSAASLPLGLYLLVETRVPEQVTTTCNPFFLSLPMTTIDGDQWNYDVTVYPKNQTGMPTLEKTVRESKSSTGKNGGSVDSITDGYAHTASASTGDSLEYQIISTLPTITSASTSLSAYTFTDTLSSGIAYKKGDVAIEIFKDSACTQRIALWTESQDFFSVAYDDATNKMTIAMRTSGLSYLNTTADAYDASALQRGCSGCTMRITYACTLKSGAQTSYGDASNDNTVQLLWKRTNTDFYDTLEDDCHVFTYALDLTKQFSDGAGNFSKVHFRIQNGTDHCYLIAEKSGSTYFVTGFTSQESTATVFTPDATGHIVVKGIEDDVYTLTEIATDANYTLLKDHITVSLQLSSGDTCTTCHKTLLRASASVNGDAVSMTTNGSTIPLTVMNTRGFTLPKTGSYGTWMFTAGGAAFLLCGGALLVLLRKKKIQD